MFEVGDKVFCIVNGEGEVVEVSGEVCKVQFGDNFHLYMLDGRMIVNGFPSKMPTLYKQKPKIVTDSALIDDAGRVVGDKDLIVFGKKGEFLFRAGFYDAKNQSIFTKDGFRNPKAIFKSVTSDTFIYKVELKKEIFDEFLANLHDEMPKNNEKTEENDLEIEIIEPPSPNFDEILVEETPNEMEKTAQEEEKAPKKEEKIPKKEEKDYFFVELEGGEVTGTSQPSFVKLAESQAIIRKNKGLKTRIDFKLEKDTQKEIFVSVSFTPKVIISMIESGTFMEAKLKDYVEIFDALVVDKSNPIEPQQVQLPLSFIDLEPAEELGMYGIKVKIR